MLLRLMATYGLVRYIDKSHVEWHVADIAMEAPPQGVLVWIERILTCLVSSENTFDIGYDYLCKSGAIRCPDRGFADRLYKEASRTYRGNFVLLRLVSINSIPHYHITSQRRQNKRYPRSVDLRWDRPICCVKICEIQIVVSRIIFDSWKLVLSAPMVMARLSYSATVVYHVLIRTWTGEQ